MEDMVLLFEECRVPFTRVPKESCRVFGQLAPLFACVL